jgi:acetyltransferase-like isoleucine patch superfamily enzyme
VRRGLNRFLHLLARFSPGATTLRVYLHRLRGVKISGKVFIGEDVFLESEYPQRVEIRDGVEIALRSILMAHFKGPGRLIVDREAYIGPNSTIAVSEGRTLVIGEGAVVGAGSVVTHDVPAYTFVSGVPAQPIAKVRIPAARSKTYSQFLLGLRPLKKSQKK